MPYISTRELPPILRRVLSQVGYRSPDIEVRISEEARPYFSAGKGQRAFAAPVNLLTEKYEIHWGSWGGPNIFVSPRPPDDPNAPPVPIPPNGVLILGVIGHPSSYAIVYISPHTAAPLLPEAPTLTKEELVALFCVDYYRGESRRECLQEYGVRPTTVDRLVAMRLLKRDARGALQISTMGKNALAQSKAWSGCMPPPAWQHPPERPSDYYGE